MPPQNYTQQQLKEFQEKFKKKKNALWCAVVPLILIGLALSYAGSQKLIPPELIITYAPYIKPVGFVILTFFMLFLWKVWRCPACDKYLGKGMKKFCPHCGVELAA